MTGVTCKGTAGTTGETWIGGGMMRILAKSLALGSIVLLWCGTARASYFGTASYLKTHHGGARRAAPARRTACRPPRRGTDRLRSGNVHGDQDRARTRGRAEIGDRRPARPRNAVSRRRCTPGGMHRTETRGMHQDHPVYQDGPEDGDVHGDSAGPAVGDGVRDNLRLDWFVLPEGERGDRTVLQGLTKLSRNGSGCCVGQGRVECLEGKLTRPPPLPIAFVEKVNRGAVAFRYQR